MLKRSLALGLALVLATLGVASCTGGDAPVTPFPATGGNTDDAAAATSAQDGSPSPPIAPVADGSSEDRDAATDADTDGSADAGADADAGVVCPRTPDQCTSTMQTCSNNCKVSYNICVNDCPHDLNLQNCVNACKASVASCQVPCKSDCTTCANNAGSCTGEPDCQKKIFAP